MIIVTADFKKQRVVVTGHANFSAKGTDVVCSAASILTHTLAKNLEIMQATGIIEKCETRLEDGFAAITYDGGDLDCANFIISSALTGYDLLAAHHPDCVEVRTIDESGCLEIINSAEYN